MVRTLSPQNALTMNAYRHLLSSLCEQSGQDPSGFEGGVLRVEIEGREAAVLPASMPDGEEAVEIVVAVGPLPAADIWDEVDALSLLHRLNAAAWPRHSWLAALDEDDRVVLRRLVPLNGLTAAELDPWLAQGLDRAASLRGLLDEALEPGTAGGLQVAGDALVPMIKG